MKILADPGIAQVEEAFSTLGTVRLLPGRDWTPSAVRDADLLCVRSVTRVDAALLEGSRVKFVATATAGLEHVDRAYLGARGIGLARAHASNANAVAEYVLSAVLRLCAQRPLSELTAGVIGFGAIGSRLVAKLEALEIACLVNDPPLAQTARPREFVSLEETLTADIVTVHVPLTGSGAFPTVNLIDAEALDRLEPGACLINTARGGVVEEGALLERLRRRTGLRAVVDCWLGEPDISPELLAQVNIGTAHIAGHSLDAKVAGTAMIYEAACRYFRRPCSWRPTLPQPGDGPRLVEPAAGDDEVLRSLVLDCYDVARDSLALKAALPMTTEERRRHFDALRTNYGVRREFHTVRVAVPSGRTALAQKLRALGFELAERRSVIASGDSVS